MAIVALTGCPALKSGNDVSRDGAVSSPSIDDGGADTLVMGPTAEGDDMIRGDDESATDGSSDGMAAVSATTYVHPSFDRPPPPSEASWTPLPGCASAVGSGIIVSCDFESMLQWDPVSGLWREFAIVTGKRVRQVTIGLDGTLWAVDDDGHILKWDGSSLALFAAPFVATSVASGTGDEETWAVASDGGTWRWSGEQWAQIVHAPMALKIAVFSQSDPACGGHVAAIIDSMDSSIYFYDCNTAAFVHGPGGALDISTDFLVGTNGTLYQWSADMGGWVTYISSPFGLATRIGSWGGGVFAMSTLSGHVQQIRP